MVRLEPEESAIVNGSLFKNKMRQALIVTYQKFEFHIDGASFTKEELDNMRRES